MQGNLVSFTYGSLCSGIGSEVVAWNPLGWKPQWFSEIDPFCCSLLCQKYPDTPNLGDIRKIRDAQKVDLIVGGTPCQSFSINSTRKGLDDPRGKLSLYFARVVARVQSKWVLWENVPNALSVDRGKAFGCIVRALGKCGYCLAYRVLDLQSFGVPQRRRRLFLVGYRGRCSKAVAALFDEVPAKTNGRQAKEVQQGGMVRIDGWTGDETPKRGVGCCPTLRSGQGGEGTGVIDRYGLRKLTVAEHERLQGFPDGYTAIEHRGKLATDKTRQRALGNAFPPPILRWLGHRIRFVVEN